MVIGGGDGDGYGDGGGDGDGDGGGGDYFDGVGWDGMGLDRAEKTLRSCLLDLLLLLRYISLRRWSGFLASSKYNMATFAILNLPT